jgi:(4-(4-[2-(gamma-L-glutamylamino)ethyl]phenoxymethyl)furan-2-yl)methanamine synthase
VTEPAASTLQGIDQATLSMLREFDIIAFDIGGANLKASDGLGWSANLSFQLWKRHRELPVALEAVVKARRPRRIVATMTGEICDCYPSRAAGVAQIAESLAVAARSCPEPPGIYLVDGRIVPPADAAAAWPLAAASNWHALARLAGAYVASGRAMLLDVGSTTTDIVPLVDGYPAETAHDDAGRMLAGELVYTGVERTNVAAVTGHLPHRDHSRPLASELFAESRDAWLVLGGLPENAAASDTADGGPATREAARVRLARTMLLDPETFTGADARAAAEAIAERQAAAISAALCRVADRSGGPPASVLLSGHGDQLAERAIAMTGWISELVRLADLIGAAAARVAPAHALACIAREDGS